MYEKTASNACLVPTGDPEGTRPPKVRKTNTKVSSEMKKSTYASPENFKTVFLFSPNLIHN